MAMASNLTSSGEDDNQTRERSDANNMWNPPPYGHLVNMVALLVPPLFLPRPNAYELSYKKNLLTTVSLKWRLGA